MKESRLFHPSSRPAGHGITIGTPRMYDLSANLLFFGTRRRTYRTLLEAARVKPDDHTLDIGCGPGYLTRMLADAVGPAGSAIGIDAAPEMIEYARRKAGRLPNCRFEAGTAESLPSADGSLDVVISSLMMHHLPEEIRLRAVREMKRVLRPAGTLLLADFTIPKQGVWHLVGLLHRPREMMHRISPLEPLITEAGFTDVRSGEAPPWLHYVRATKP